MRQGKWRARSRKGEKRGKIRRWEEKKRMEVMER